MISKLFPSTGLRKEREKRNEERKAITRKREGKSAERFSEVLDVM